MLAFGRESGVSAERFQVLETWEGGTTERERERERERLSDLLHFYFTWYQCLRGHPTAVITIAVIDIATTA